MSINKRVFIFLIVACLTVFFLPLNAFAAAAPTSIPFSSLDPAIQNDFYDCVQDIINFIFSDGSSSKTYTDEDGNTYTYTAPSLYESVKTAVSGLEEERLLELEIIYNGDESTKNAYLGVTTTTYFVPGFGSLIELVARKAAVHFDTTVIPSLHFSSDGGVHAGSGSYRDSPTVDTVINSYDTVGGELLQGIGAVDNGKSIFSDLKSVCPYISDIQVFDFNTFDYKYDLTGCQSWSRYDPVPSIYLYYVDGQHLIEVAAWQLYNANEWFRYWIDDQGRLLNSTSSNENGTIRYTFQSPFPENIIVIKYLPVAPSDINVFRNPVAEYVITDEDFITTPGVNPSYVSDVQKAAIGYASQLGIDYGTFIQQYGLTTDSSGNKAFVHLGTGTLYGLEAGLKLYNETNAGNTAIVNSLNTLIESLKEKEDSIAGIGAIVAAIEGTLTDISSREQDRDKIFTDLAAAIDGWKTGIDNLDTELTEGLGAISASLVSIQELVDAIGATTINPDFNDFQVKLIKVINNANFFSFPLFDQCVEIISTVFNYDDQLTAPNFDFYYDSDNNGTSEQYKLIDMSVLDQELNNSHTVDKSLFATPIKVITLIRYILCAVIYGLFAVRLIKRLPDFYASTPWFLYPNFKG